MMKELSMHILDIAQNSISAGAKNVAVTIIENAEGNRLSFEITDDGCGMSEEILANVRNPFTTTRTTRKVGLGIPMLEQTCLQCGGNLELESTPGKGTRLFSYMDYDNIDRPPMGDIENTMFLLILMNENINFIYTHVYNGNEYVLDTAEVKEALEGVSFSNRDVSEWLKANIAEGIAEIKA